MRRRPPWTRDLRAVREARHAEHMAHRLESMQRHERKRWSGPPPVGIAVITALVQIFGTRAAAYGSTGPHVLDRNGYLLLLAAPLALLVRERWPLVSLLAALVPTVAYFSLAYPDGPGFVAAIVAMFTALAAGYRWLTWAAVAVAYGVFVGLALPEVSESRVVLIGVWCLVIAGFGEAARVRGVRYSQMARDWSAQQQLARAEEEKARQEQERRQASDERLLIARELHDVIGHHLSLINVQAGVGLHLMDEQPEQARIALAAIKHASAEALRETRAVLAGLNPGEAAPRTPAPGLRDLDRLAAEARAVGLPVTVDTGETSGTGDASGPLPPQVDRAAFRIVQEALTNVRRHAGPGATATIVIARTPGELTIHVTDDGQGGTTRSGPPQGSDSADGVGRAGTPDQKPPATVPPGRPATALAPPTDPTTPAAPAGRATAEPTPWGPTSVGRGTAGPTPVVPAPAARAAAGPSPAGLTSADQASASPRAAGTPSTRPPPSPAGVDPPTPGPAGGATPTSGPVGGAVPSAGGTGGAAGARVDGNGIAGMRHRAAAFGGSVEAGPRPGGGFEVRARIPVREDQQ